MAEELNFDELKNAKIASEEYLVFIQKKTNKLEEILLDPEKRTDFRKDGNTYVVSGYIEDGYIE